MLPTAITPDCVRAYAEAICTTLYALARNVVPPLMPLAVLPDCAAAYGHLVALGGEGVSGRDGALQSDESALSTRVRREPSAV